jgi:hypothetical protein
MIYFGCALVAFWIAGFFYGRPRKPDAEPDDGRSAIDRWVTRHAEDLMRTIFIVIGLLWIYGVYFYPDAPIKRCDDGFCGKHGPTRTLAEFRSYEKWESLLFFSFFLGFLSLLYLRTKLPPDRRGQ